MTGGAVYAHLGYRAVPALEVLGQRLQAVETAPFQRVGLHVSAASFGHPVFLWVAGPRRQWHETPVFGECGVDLADVRVVQAGAYDRGLQIVVPDDLRYTLQPNKCVLVGAQKPVAFLGP